MNEDDKGKPDWLEQLEISSRKTTEGNDGIKKVYNISEPPPPQRTVLDDITDQAHMDQVRANNADTKPSRSQDTGSTTIPPKSD